MERERDSEPALNKHQSPHNPPHPLPHLELTQVVRPLENGLEVLVLGGRTAVDSPEVHLSGAAVDGDHVVLLQLHLAELSRCRLPGGRGRGRGGVKQRTGGEGRGEERGVFSSSCTPPASERASCPNTRVNHRRKNSSPGDRTTQRVSACSRDDNRAGRPHMAQISRFPTRELDYSFSAQNSFLEQQPHLLSPQKKQPSRGACCTAPRKQGTRIVHRTHMSRRFSEEMSLTTDRCVLLCC